MKTKIILSLLAVTGMAQAATLSLSNANFQDSGHNTNPTSWVTTETAQSSVYVWAANGGIPAGTNVLAMWGNAGQNVQQSFATIGSGGATADQYNDYTITFDAGWRGRAVGQPFSFTLSLINVTDSTILGSATYTLPAPTVAVGNTYAVHATGASVNFTYNNTLGSLVGDTVALRISGAGTTNDGGVNTAWVDNISVTAIPEPSAALLGGLGLLALLRRRRA